MKPQKTIPALLLTITLSLTLFGCTDNSGNASSAANSQANQPTSASNSNAAAGGCGGDQSNSSSTDSSGNSGSGNAGLTVVQYAYVCDNANASNYYIGVVKNEGSATVNNVEMNLVDASGTVVGDTDYQLLRGVFGLPPGQSVGFSIMQGIPVQHPQFAFKLLPPSGDSDKPIKIIVISSTLATASDGSAHVEGEVRNDGDSSADIWMVDVIGYDTNGNVVAVGSGDAADTQNTPRFTAHSTMKFRAILKPGNAKVAKYDLFAPSLTYGQG